MPRSRVFISYRRDDAAGFSHAIHDRLADHLGRGQVFMDVHGIAPGADFVQRLQGVVQDCDVLVALIGRRWAGERAGGGARLHDPDDWVRIEIATALQRGIRVIPVLLDGAKMSDAADLPAEVRGQMLASDGRARVQVVPSVQFASFSPKMQASSQLLLPTGKPGEIFVMPPRQIAVSPRVSDWTPAQHP